MKLKEVSLLTGFLGAGKTTLLNAIISNRKNTRYAIIENEIGEESIDAELVIKNKEDIIELNNGCLCCSLNDNLYDIINALWKRNTEWDEVIIEATGIADPASIAQPFLVNPQIMQAFILKRVICVVDVELVEDQLKETDEAIKQIAFSDSIVLNKVEKVSNAYITQLKKTLTQINPFANVFALPKQNFNIEEILAHQRAEDFQTNPKTVLSKIGMVSLSTSNSALNTVSAPFGFKSTHVKHQHSTIETILIRFPEFMDLEMLEHRLFVFLMVQSKGVYRIKGLVNSPDHDHKVIVQSVGKSVSLSFGEPWAEQKRENKLVVIGKNIKVRGFEKLFRDCIQKTG